MKPLYETLKEWSAKQFKTFTADDFKADNETLTEANIKALGGCFLRLKKSGMIIEKGTVISNNPKSKGRRVIVYISKAYSDQQKNNRTYKQPTLF